MIAKPTTSNFGPGNFLSRVVVKTECQTESYWVKFLDKKSNTSIQWDYYWWIRSHLPFWLAEGNFLEGR